MTSKIQFDLPMRDKAKIRHSASGEEGEKKKEERFTVGIILIFESNHNASK